MAIDKIQAESINLADTFAFTGTVSGTPTSPSFKNIIINGDMQIAQRTTSSSSISSGATYIVDRFFVSPSSAGTWTMSQSTTTPTGQGFGKSFKMDCTSATGSLGASANLIFQQRIEGQNLQLLKKGTANAESVTFSFWVRSNKTGTYTLEMYDNANARQISQTYTISSADTWEKKTVTFAGDTTGTLANDNSSALTALFWLGAGSNFTSGTLSTSWSSATNANRVSSSQINLADSTSNEWYITGLQLEVGTTASDFEFLPIDVNERRCFRYFQDYASFKLWTTALDGNTSTRLGGSMAYNTRMRATPSVSKTNNTGTIDSQTITDRGYSVFAEKSNRGTTTNVTDLEFDSEL